MRKKYLSGATSSVPSEKRLLFKLSNSLIVYVIIGILSHILFCVNTYSTYTFFLLFQYQSESGGIYRNQIRHRQNGRMDQIPEPDPDSVSIS
jgi:hypothetical protein